MIYKTKKRKPSKKKKSGKVTISRINKIDSLRLTIIKEPKNNEYKYLITTGATSWSAFHTKAGFNKWLKDTGVKIDKSTTDSNEQAEFSAIKGSYERISMRGNKKSFDAFGKKNNFKQTKVLSNGDYTKGFVEKGKDGNKIYYLNPNDDRKIYKHKWV